MEQCLVTGGAGYVGSHFCKALANAGFLPVTVDNLSRGHEEAVKWGPLLKGDIRDGAFLDRVFHEHWPIRCVFHFAALAYVGESVEKPNLYYDNNFCGAKSLLDAMLRAAPHGEPVPPIVFSSTCATYGVPQTDTISESHPQWPINPYGWSKLFVERMLNDYSEAYGLRFAALRYFNACGADEDGEIGELHEPETHLIPLVLRAAKTHSAVKVFGTNYPTPDGSAIRDYVHVSDLADAHVLAMEHLLGGSMSMKKLILNLGTGRGYSVREVVEEARRVTGADFGVVDAPPRQGDPPKLVASSGLAESVLGWRPKRSSLRNVIETAWRFERGRGNGSQFPQS
ncbi:MAG: UDP-glucose 4-epimerase GalE [Synergistaceae bacterium]|jgi:UDP-glucose-4-epimerase GalE|nr:UDP-glucose 4-epimerase GalE [Synergistaceae bacterium]